MFQDPEFLRQTDDYEALDRAARALSREVRDLEDEDRYNFKSKSYWTNHESWSIIIESTISGDLARPDPRNWSWPSRSPPSKMTMTQQRPSSGPNKQLIFRRWWQECKVGAVLGCFFFFFTRQLVLLKKGWFESYICRQFLSTIQNGTCGGLTEKYGPYGVTDEEIEIWALCKTVSTFKTKMPCHSTYQST